MSLLGAISLLLIIALILTFVLTKAKASKDRKRINEKLVNLYQFLEEREIFKNMNATIVENQDDLVQFETEKEGVHLVYTISTIPKGIVVHVLFHLRTPNKIVEDQKEYGLELEVQDLYALGVQAGDKHKEVYPEEWDGFNSLD